MSKRERRAFGSVRRLSSGRWQVRYRDLTGAVHTGPHTFTSKADAARYLAMIEADLHRGAWADPKLGRITLAEWAKRVAGHHNEPAADDPRSVRLPAAPVPAPDLRQGRLE